jgi:hypothetical protein
MVLIGPPQHSNTPALQHSNFKISLTFFILQKQPVIFRIL